MKCAITPCVHFTKRLTTQTREVDCSVAILRSHTTSSTYNKINEELERHRIILLLHFKSLRPSPYTLAMCDIFVEPLPTNMLSWCDGVFVDFVIRWQCRAWRQNSKTVVNFRQWNHNESTCCHILAIRTSGVSEYNVHTIVALRTVYTKYKICWRHMHSTTVCIFYEQFTCEIKHLNCSHNVQTSRYHRQTTRSIYI